MRRAPRRRSTMARSSPPRSHQRWQQASTPEQSPSPPPPPSSLLPAEQSPGEGRTCCHLAARQKLNRFFPIVRLFFRIHKYIIPHNLPLYSKERQVRLQNFCISNYTQQHSTSYFFIFYNKTKVRQIWSLTQKVFKYLRL